MNSNHTIEKNKISEDVKTINSAFCLAWMVRSLQFLSGFPCSIALGGNEVSRICGLVDEEIFFFFRNDFKRGSKIIFKLQLLHNFQSTPGQLI